AFPGPGPGRQLELRRRTVLLRETPFREVRAVVEQVVTFQLKQRLGNRQFPSLGHGVRHMVELRRIIDGSEEPSQVVKERVIAAADECLNGLAVGRSYRYDLVEINHR